MNQYLIVYRKSTGLVMTCDEYPGEDLQHVVRERARLERIYGPDGDMEVVALGANSPDDLVRTHSRYFKTLSQLATSG